MKRCLGTMLISSSPISEITNDAIMTVDGERHEVDCIIFVTGFKSNDLMWPIDIVGKDSKSIREIWGDTPNAYKGISVPGASQYVLLVWTKYEHRPWRQHHLSGGVPDKLHNAMFSKC